MNIQLRDSKPLQDALKRRGNRNMLPKAQLHPELLDGVVDADREGFNVRSELLTGEHRGESNPQDVQNLKDFLPAAVECVAAWKVVELKQGESTQRIPSELVFTFAGDNGKLVIHTQAVSDVTKLTSALPSDRTAKFNAVPGEGRITFTLASAEKRLMVSPLSEAELKTQAAIVGVKWDVKASRETMLEKINAAREAKEKAKDAVTA